MKTKMILRLSKSIFFIFGLIVYGFLIQNPKSWWATLVFGLILWAYLSELHKECKND